MSSTASRRSDDLVPAPPAAPDGEIDLFAPATPVGADQPGPAPLDRGVEPAASEGSGTGRHARHRRTDDPPGPVAADPAPGPEQGGPEQGGPEHIEAPAWLPAAQAARTPPAGVPVVGPGPVEPVEQAQDPAGSVPSGSAPAAAVPAVPAPVFDVPQVRVRERYEVTAPAPPPLHRDRAPAGAGSTAGPARPGSAQGAQDTARPAPRPDVDRTIPRSAPAGPPGRSPAHPPAGGPPTPRPSPVTPADESSPPTRPVRVVRPPQSGPTGPSPSATPLGPPPAQASSPGMAPVQSSSARLPRVRPAPFPPAYGTSPGMAPAPGSSPGIVPPAHGTSPGMLVRPSGPPSTPAPPPPSPRPPAPPASRRGRSAGDGFGSGAPWGDGPGRRAARFALHLVTTTRATRELAELAEAAQLPVTTGRRIAVVSVRGGAGRSAVTALLGSVFSARRADHVLVADADPDHGSLAWRLGVEQPEPLGPLAARLLAARGVAELDSVLPRTPAGLWALPGAVGAPPGLVRDVTRALSRFFAICVTDCGRGLENPGTVDVLQDAHAAVVVAPATPDGVRSTRVGLSRLPAALLSRTVVVLSTVDRGGRAALDLGATRGALAGAGVAVVTLPYDRHLAAATTISPARLAEATTIEATRLAGQVLRCATDRAWSPGTGGR